MGVEKPKSRISEFIARACRIPREVAGRFGNLSDSMAKERLKVLQSQDKIPYEYLAVAIIILLCLPLMILFTYVIPPQVEVIFGSEVDSESYCSIISSSHVGVTHAVLLNTTPFSINGDWELDPNRYWNQYDFISYGWNDSDGYHFASSPSEYSIIVLERTMQIPIANYSELTVTAEFEGISGSTGIFFEVFADEARAFQEELILSGNITKVIVTAPMAAAKLACDSWLGTIVCRMQIGLAEESHIKLRGISITAEFTGKMSRVQLDFKSTDNSSLYANPYMKFAKYAPRLAIIQNDDYISQSTYFPSRVDDEIYLPPGTYEGVVYWNLATQDPPDPYNSSMWVPNVSFIVSEDIAMEIDVGLFAKRIDFDVSPSVLLRSLSLRFADEYQYIEPTEIFGSTVYSQFPDHLYIPGEIDSLSIWIYTWSSLDPREGGGWIPYGQFLIEEDIIIGSNNKSRNLIFSIALPYIALGGALFGLGEFVILAVIVLLVIGFIISLRRVLRYSDIRHRLSDSRILPLFLLSAGVFLPWSIQLAQTTNSGYDGVSWLSWFSMPFMIRWSDSTAIQLLMSTRDWWSVTLSFTLFLFIPLCYGYISLASIENERFNKTFALSLILPYYVVLSGFNFSAISLGTISLGPMFVLAALPVWLLRLGLRKLQITT
ncbi:MAG: hypothetical protein E4H14_11050 [Candidatus Thorarchaeota archaeon]|nr:MAG: hypothetical protein E4H14_11050 [Candidatus Thorarchaeota archaeon]